MPISEVDPFVQQQVPATSGYLYLPIQGKLPRYPIPELRLPPGQGARLLDIGCNWGRWSIAAAQKGYRVSGIDLHLDAIPAAQRVAAQLGLDIDYRYGASDAIPFPDDSFDVVFSYSVLQHLPKREVRSSVAEIARVLKPGGVALVQMPNWLGIRSLQHQARRRFRRTLRHFAVDYWGLRELRRTFGVIGPVTLSADGFFGLGIQASDLDLMPVHYRAVVHASEGLRWLARYIPSLVYVADSVYVTARKPA